jgi:glyoxylase-like metal-dependent hydrolase (beta-lactamase superfamily II)
VLGGKDCEAVSKTPAHQEKFNIGQGIEVTALHTPCHTQDSICWYMEDKSKGEKVVFTGDTLFHGGQEPTTFIKRILIVQDAASSSREHLNKCILH